LLAFQRFDPCFCRAKACSTFDRLAEDFLSKLIFPYAIPSLSVAIFSTPKSKPIAPWAVGPKTSGNDENGLAAFSQSAAAGTLASFTNEKLINQAIRACIALGHRSAYGMFMTMSAMEAVNGSLHETAVANVLHSIGQKFRVFSTWQFMVLYDLPVPLLISERPFLDFTSRGQNMVAMPLGPRSLMLGTPNDNPSVSKIQLRVGPAAPEHHRIAKMHNHASVEMARQWIVAESRAELDAVHSELTTEKVLSRRRTDRVILGNVSG
jgi:hypothetical protein